MQVLALDDVYVLNHCTKYLSRSMFDTRHNFGQFTDNDLRSSVCESWRFPIIDDFRDVSKPQAGNLVTFVYFNPSLPTATTVSVVGSFANLFDPIPLQRIANTPYFALSVVIPKSEVHFYRYLVDGNSVLDPINPQQTILDNGKPWSRFFTHLCSELISLEHWEAGLLERLTDHILPFRTEDGQKFVERYYDEFDKQRKIFGPNSVHNLELSVAFAYRLDQSVGVVNFIDKVLAKEENHNLKDYRNCLKQIDRILRKRNPYTEPALVAKTMYEDLYSQMAQNTVSDWGYKDKSPLSFLQLLRRHAFTGAFAHPKYGGNVGGLAWAYLEDTFRADDKHTLFDWRRSIEAPLGTNTDYYG
jgi:Gluconate 2-dehydrogenase subunit 3